MGKGIVIIVKKTRKIYSQKKTVAHLFFSGVLKAVSHVNDVIAPALLKAQLDVKNQEAIDKFLIDLDGTDNKGELFFLLEI